MIPILQTRNLRFREAESSAKVTQLASSRTGTLAPSAQTRVLPTAQPLRPTKGGAQGQGPGDAS